VTPTPAAAARRIGPWPARRWAWVAAIWLAYGALDWARNYLRHALADDVASFPAGEAAWERLVDAAAWTLFTPAILWVVERWTLRRERRAGPLLALLAAGVGFALLGVAANWAAGPLLTGSDTTYLRYLGSVVHANLLSYAALVAVGHVLAYQRRGRERAVRAAQLEAQLAVARLEALKTQIEPHFLFNALGSVSELIHENPAAAERMVTSLRDLLHLTLERGPAPEVTLRDELRVLDAYLRIQQTRFQDRLRARAEVDPDTLDACVPALVLQPLVENAVKHGIAPRAAPGHVVVAARRQGSDLLLEVRDDGVGFRPRVGGRQGVGLRNTLLRLERLYGPGARLEVGAAGGGGTVARVVLPFHTVPAAVPAGAGEDA